MVPAVTLSSKRAGKSNRDAFDLVERQLVVRTVVQLRRSRRFVRSDLLRLSTVPPFSRYAVIPVARNV
jgi:hypothetical protein